MASLDDLPADQRAVLSLLVKQARGYDQIATLLRLERRAVRERALDALDALGPQEDTLGAEEQDLVADHLLGQSAGAEREEAEALLAESPPVRTWAAAVLEQLAPLDPGGRLPALPAAEPAPVPVAAPVAPMAPDDPAAMGVGAPAPVLASEQGATVGTTPEGRTSRGGLVLMVGAVVVLVAAVVAFAVTGGFSSTDDTGASAGVSSAPATPAAGTTAAAATPAQVQQQIELAPSAPGSEALGVAQVVRSGSTTGLAVAAQDLSAGYYAVWLFNSPTDAAFLGFAPRVSDSGEGAGQLQGLSQTLPQDLARFDSVVISRQTVTAQNRNATPSRPGTVVLRGRLRG